MKRHKRMDPMHAVRIQLMYQELNIRGNDLVRRWPQYLRYVIYHGLPNRLSRHFQLTSESSTKTKKAI